MSPVARRRFVGASMLWSLTGCQLVFGDFTVDTSETPAPATITLGDTCGPDTFMCDAEQLERCSDDRNSWVTIASCADADHCDPQAAACRACVPGQWACNGPALETCDANAHWQLQTPCASAELCTVAGDRSSGSCAMPVCATAGAYSCDGNRLLRCSSGLDTFEVIERCGSSALCDADAANAEASATTLGTCVAPTCLAGTYACDGATLEQCLDDETGWTTLTTCSDAASCNVLTGTCGACAPGDAACSGAGLWTCGANGFAETATCALPALCEPTAGSCDQPACSTPGALRCTNVNGTELEECGTDLRWGVREACASRALCSETAGACLPPACDLGEKRCFGQVHQTCSNDRSSWVDDETCPADEACDPTNGCVTGCTGDVYRCDGAALEHCNAGTWEVQNRCATSALCDATATRCDAPICGGPLGDYMCSGEQNLKGCTPGRNTWGDLLTCDAGTYCDADATAHSCDACQPLQYSCENESEIHLCSADGSTTPLVMRCPAACTVSADNVPSCVQMP